MATRNYVWRTAPTGTEGTNTVYVDSYTGSDIFGDGTRAKPYKTLTNALVSKPSRHVFICRGSFSDNITNNHSSFGPLGYIYGDFLGAATFNGNNLTALNNFSHGNMIIKNVNGNYIGNYGINSSSGGYGYFGIGGSNNILINCGLNGEKIIFKGTQYNNIFAKIPCNLSLKSFNNSANVSHYSFYNHKIFITSKDTGIGIPIRTSLFCDFDRPANETITYDKCLFSSDTEWYYLTSDTYNSATDEKITLSYGEGTTSATRQQELHDKLEQIYEAKGVAAESRVYPTFTDCIFSAQTSAQIFNNPDHDDYTLIPGCDADLGNGEYIGALPPCKNIPIMEDSSGVKETWDERSASGCVVVDDGRICIDDSSDGDGEILSKVLAINPVTTQFNAVYANLISQFADYHAYANINSILSTNAQGQVIQISPKNDPEEAATESNTLVAGNSYLMTADCTYNGQAVSSGNVLVCQAADTEKFFTADPLTNCKACEILEPNVMEVLYCRCRSAIYARVGVNDDLQAGATYLNDSGMNITYHDRTIVNGESFVCMVGGSLDRFTCADTTKKIAVLFDDTRVPAVEWIPAHTFGEYFVAKTAGAIVKDAYDVPKSSGNLRAYPTTGLNLSTMDRKYVQFAVKVKRYVAQVD